MNTLVTAPAWNSLKASPESVAGALHQLVNIAGPLGGGMAVVLCAVQAAEMAEAEGTRASLDRDQRQCLMSMCVVSSQLLMDAAADACNRLQQETETGN